MPLHHRILRCLLLPLAALAWAAAPLGATWSIILIDRRTGEVAIGSATCVTSFDLRALSPVVLVGVGAAAAQSFVDSSGANRLLIRNELLAGTDPVRILQLLAAQDPGHQTRQYGIVDVQGRALGFTGTSAFAWAGHLTGSDGDLVWAIQGNLLAGEPVVRAAEQAVRATSGDLAAKLMAAMEAARAAGGDARCTTFQKSSHIGYMVVARQGDPDGPCNVNVGCAAGSYWLNLNVAFQAAARPDPVLQLRAQFDQWRTSWLGRPDHHLSTAALSSPVLPADGRTVGMATLTLRDWRGVRVPGTGARVAVSLDPASTAQVGIGAVIPQGGGVYLVPLTAGTAAGTALLRVEVDDGAGPVLLSPRTALELTADGLWASPPAFPAADGGVVDFVLQGGAARAARPYVLMGSASGSSPGIRVPPVTVPLNPDFFFDLSLQLANTWVFPASVGFLDPVGRGTTAFVAPPGALVPLAGRDLTFAWVALSPLDFASNPVSVRLR